MHKLNSFCNNNNKLRVFSFSLKVKLFLVIAAIKIHGYDYFTLIFIKSVYKLFSKKIKHKTKIIFLKFYHFF